MKYFSKCFAIGFLLLTGCATTTPPAVFLPIKSSETVPFFRNGVAIGALNSDSTYLLVSLEPTAIAHHEYMRLWFLCKNKSDSPFLLEPLKVVTLRMEGGAVTFDVISPESPTKILAHIKNEEARTMIFQAVGGTLEALSAQPTTIRNAKGEEWTVNDTSAKVAAINKKTLESIKNTAFLYDTFKNSINSGILRRNTIFPQESVNGYIYFPLPQIRNDVHQRIKLYPAKYTYKLSISTQFSTKMVEFTPAEGE